MSIFRRTWYVDQSGKQCKKSTPGARKVTADTYTIQLSINGKVKKFSGYSDRRATEQKEAQLIRQFARSEVGLVDPFAEHKNIPLRNHWVDADGKPVAKGTAGAVDRSHLAVYLSELESVGRDSEHVYIVRRRLEKLFEACGWNYLPDISADAYTRWREQQQQQKKKPAPTTLNQYLQALRAFCRWCVKRGRMATDPLAAVEQVKVNGDIRRQRRALTDAEMTRLLSTAGDRKAVYLTAVLTGLRRSELAALVWGDMHLDAPRPFMTVRGSTTKNGKDATLWLRDDLVTELRLIRPANAEPSEFIFADRMPSMDRFRSDLAAANIAGKDGQGRRVDFHSLRHTLATNLARAGVSIRTAMDVMRHSDAKLTTKTYTDAGQLPTADAIDALPRFDAPQPEQNRMKATGTYNATADQVETKLRRTAGFNGQQLVTMGSIAAAIKLTYSVANGADTWGFNEKSRSIVDRLQVHQLGLEPRTR